MYVYVCVCMYACMYACVHMCVCLYMCTYVCVYVCMRVCMYACMRVCMYACACARACVRGVTRSGRRRCMLESIKFYCLTSRSRPQSIWKQYKMVVVHSLSITTKCYSVFVVRTNSYHGECVVPTWQVCRVYCCLSATPLNCTSRTYWVSNHHAMPYHHDRLFTTIPPRSRNDFWQLLK